MSSSIQLQLLITGDRDTFDRCIALAKQAALHPRRTRADVQSIVSRTIDELLQALERGQDLAEAKVEIVKVVRRVCDRRRQERLRWKYGIDPLLPDYRQPSPDAACERDELLQIIYALLMELPDPGRYAIIAVLIEGRTTKSVAEQFDIKHPTLRKQLARTRQKLRAQLTLMTDERRLTEADGQ
jgi:RNA polymerase sigma factor (sigma-70 family)